MRFCQKRNFEHVNTSARATVRVASSGANKGFSELVSACMTIFICLVLALELSFNVAPMLAFADESSEQFDINLSQESSEENITISTDNMFPGDSESAVFHLVATYDNAALVGVTLDIVKADEGLLGAMDVQLVRTNTGEVLFDGTALEFSNSTMHSLPVDNQAESKASSDESTNVRFKADEYYTLFLNLPTTATNEASGQDLVVRLRWQIAKDEANALPSVDKNTSSSASSSGSSSAASSSSSSSAAVATTTAPSADVKTPTPLEFLAQMGDTLGIVLLTLILLALVACSLMLGMLRRRKAYVFADGENSEARKTASKNFRRAVVAEVILCLAFFLVSYAVISSDAVSGENRVHTGSAGIELNGGQPVLDDLGDKFEPGVTEVRTFTVTNTGTWAEWYKVYFDEMQGGLADALDVTLVDDEGTQLYSGKAADFTKDSTGLASGMLALGQTRTLTLTIHYPESEDNTHQGDTLTFALRADAVQAKNNPDAEFE